MPNNTEKNTEDNKISNSMEIEFKDIFNFLKKHRSPFLKITTSTLLITFLYSTFARKTWEGYTKIVLTNPDSARGLLSGGNKASITAAIGISNLSKLNTEVEILKSPSVLLPVFEFFKKEKEKDRERIKKIDFSKWFSKNFDVKLERGTTVLNLSYKDNNKKRIIKVLQKTISEYQNFPQRNKSNESDREIEYLKEQVKSQNQKTKISSEKFQKFILDNRLTKISNNTQEQRSSLLSQYGIQQNFNSPNGFVDIFNIKSSLENELLKINYLSEEFDKIKNNNNALLVFSLTLENQTKSNSISGKTGPLKSSNIRSMILDLNSEIEQKKIYFKETDKNIINLEKRRDVLFDLLKTEIRNILKSSVNSINANKSITDKWSKDVLVQYSEYTRNAQKDESILSNLEDSLRLAMLQKAKNANPWELITEPTIKPRPVWPIRKLFLLPIGFILGIFLSLLYVLVKEKKFKDFL